MNWGKLGKRESLAPVRQPPTGNDRTNPTEPGRLRAGGSPEQVDRAVLEAPAFKLRFLLTMRLPLGN